MPNLQSILSILKKVVEADDVAIAYTYGNSTIQTSLSIIKKGKDYLLINSDENINSTNKIEVDFPSNNYLINGKLIFSFNKIIELNELQKEVINVCTDELIEVESNRLKNEQFRVHPLYKEIIVENLISNMTEGVMIFDQTHCAIHTNEAADQIFGIDLSPSIYKVNTSVIEEGENEFILLEKNQFPSQIALNGEKVENAIYYVKNKEHPKGVFVKVNATPILNDGSDIIAAVVTLNNINTSIEQESEIKQQRDLLQQASKLAEVGYWELNLNSQTVYWSDITRKIHEVEGDFQPNLAEGINFYDDESKPVITETVNHSAATGEGWDVRLKIVTAKGNRKWVRSIAKCYQEQGKTVKIAGVFQDITDEKRKEDELIESRNKALSSNEQLSETIELKNEELSITKERYSTLYNNAPDLMASVDIKTRTILDCNEQTARSLGYSKEELLGKPLFSIYHQSSHERAKKAFELFLEKEAVHDVRLILKKKDGSLLNVMLNAAAIKNEAGEIIQTNSVWRDISQLVIAEEKLKTLNASLEQKVKERTQELELANEDIEDFTYMATHDLKAPIANIKGHFGIVKGELGEINNEIVNTCIKWIDNSLELAENKIHSIVKVAQLQFQDTKKVERIDVESQINVVLSNMERIIFDTKSEIKLITNKNFSVDLIKENFDSILSNLIHNAIKYKQPELSPRIIINIDDSGKEFFISVTDNGIGFDPIAQKDKIFGMFKRIHDHVEGDGMGLHLVKKIIDKSGGRISVESKINKGSTFTVYFGKNKN